MYTSEVPLRDGSTTVSILLLGFRLEDSQFTSVRGSSGVGSESDFHSSDCGDVGGSQKAFVLSIGLILNFTFTCGFQRSCAQPVLGRSFWNRGLV